MDSNNDGIGDLEGILSKLDYIKELGIETIWISPFFKSPLRDWGYDVSDYFSIADEYGDLADVEELINQVHQREMCIILDLVLNHTSDQHPWFKESRSSRENPKRDWYIWRSGKGNRSPNNWKSVVGSSGWNYDQLTDQWYYTSFLPFQPDLNYRNPDVVKTMFDVVRYWFDTGIDGFRLDMFHTIYKDDHFRDNPWSMHFIPADFTAGFFQNWRYNRNQPEAVQLSKDLRALADSYSPEKLLLGEIYSSDADIKQYLGKDVDGLHLVFLWDLMDINLNAKTLREVIQHYEQEYPQPYTPVYVFGNHDRKRLASRINNEPKIAPLLALFQLTVRGIPVIYYGEEIGMLDVNISSRDAKDPVSHRFRRVPKFISSWLKIYPHRDGCRTPMQWNDGANAGFCDASTEPWLPVHENYDSINVNLQQSTPGSLLNDYKRLLKLRNQHRVLREGTLELLNTDGFEQQLLAYKRIYGASEMLILINFGETPCYFANTTNCEQLVFQTPQYKFSDAARISLPTSSGMILTN